MVDDGYALDSAVQRAARNQGIQLQQTRPSLEALRMAIRERRELFRPEQARQLQEQRRVALEAMRSLAGFRPRLIGSLIHGDGPLDSVRLLLIADTPEQVMMHLNDRHIPWRDAEVSLHYSARRRVSRPAVRFVAGATAIELIILDPGSRSDPPRDPISGGPLEMLDADQLHALIEREGH